MIATNKHRAARRELPTSSRSGGRCVTARHGMQAADVLGVQGPKVGRSSS